MKLTMVPAYCIKKVHGLVLVYGEKTALAGMDSLCVNELQKWSEYVRVVK